MNEKEFAELSAGHALHALSDADERRYRDARRAHPEWAAIAVDDADTAGALAAAAPPQHPDPAVRDRILALIATTPQTPVTDEPAPPARDADVPRRVPRRRRILFALAACLVLLVGIGAGAILVAQLQPSASVVALQEIESAPDAQEGTVELASGGTATAHWSESVGSVVLVTDGLEPLGAGETYELWFVRGDTPVSAGVFDAEADTTTALLEGQMHPGDAIAVTVEPAGGSPTGAPTSDPIIVIPTA